MAVGLIAYVVKIEVSETSFSKNLLKLQERKPISLNLSFTDEIHVKKHKKAKKEKQMSNLGVSLTVTYLSRLISSYYLFCWYKKTPEIGGLLNEENERVHFT